MSLEKLFTPDSIAIIGASSTRGKIGYEILENLISYGYKGDIYPINLEKKEIMGLKAHTSVLNVEGNIDLAVIAIPAKAVPSVLEECGKKGVKVVVIISSGFSEAGNAQIEMELVETAKRYKMRILGPNVFGVVYTPRSLNATFGPQSIVPGTIAFVTQSGAIGIALMDKTRVENIGLSAVVSVGNKADIDDADLLEFLQDDPNTQVILLYIEGLKRGRKFLASAAETSLKKPIITIKSGRTKRGAKAAASHTGSLAGSDRIFSAAFNQSGILRADTMEQAFDWARMASLSPVPQGEKCLIITNGGGVGVLATDACEKEGVVLLDDYQYLEKTFGPLIPSFGSTKNPIDITGQSREDAYKTILRKALNEERVDAIIILYCEAAVVDTEKFAAYIIEEVQSAAVKKPIVVSLIGGEKGEQALKILNDHGIPSFEEPEEAVSALAAFYRWWRFTTNRHSTQEGNYMIDKEKIYTVMKKAREQGRIQLLEDEAKDILQACGLNLPAYRLTTSINEALDAAEEIGYPVVLKISSEDIIHKSDIGGVKVGIQNDRELRSAYKEILYRAKKGYPRATIRGILVNEMVEEGIEIIVGCSRDPQFGPIVMFGLGGIYVEVLKDVAFRVAPIDVHDALDMIDDIKSHPLLYGVRGEKMKDINSLAETISILSYLPHEIPEIVEIDLNPLIALEDGCKVVDARMTLRGG
jgi:acetyltransferase